MIKREILKLMLNANIRTKVIESGFRNAGKQQEKSNLKRTHTFVRIYK